MNLNTCLVVILSLAITALSLAEKFESVKCGKDEFTCYGEWNDDWTEQLTSDYCIPSKIGDCWNDCPKQCHKDEIRCPGQIDRNTGCIGPDSCQAGSKLFLNSLVLAQFLWISILLWAQSFTSLKVDLHLMTYDIKRSVAFRRNGAISTRKFSIK